MGAMTTPTPPSSPSAKYALVETLLRQQNKSRDTVLSAWLLQQRAAGVSFLNIAFDLTQRTGEALTQEVVRKWVRDLEQSEGLNPSVLPGHAHHSLDGWEADGGTPAAA